VYSDGTYEVAGPAGRRLMNPETDAPLFIGQKVWYSDVWTPASYNLATGVYTPGHLTPGHFGKPVVHGPRYD
jgi:hypothetical protein